MEKKNVSLYIILTYLLGMIPILNLFGFIPMYIFYRKTNFKSYVLYSILIFLINTIFNGFTLLNFSFFVASFIFVKYFEKTKRHFDIIFSSSLVFTTLLVSEALIVKSNEKYYEIFTKLLDETYGNFIYQNYGSIENFLNLVFNYYPIIAFSISYIVCTYGYLFLYRKFFKESEEEFYNKYVFPLNIFVFLLVFVFSILINFYSSESSLNILFLNLFLGFLFIFFVEGFVLFNRLLKRKLSNLFSNLISFISIFLVLTYVLYLFYGFYVSLVRSRKWKKN